MKIVTNKPKRLFPSGTESEVGVPSGLVYRPEIDGLRALAVISVIINHFNKDLLPSGYLGVDIFFVISGYVITSSLYNRPTKNLGDFLLRFYTRRIKRLVPALTLCVGVSSILICLFNPNPDTSLKTGIRSLFGVSNLYLLQQKTDYFADSTNLNVFVHTWSLGVEEQFYMLFPFIVWFTGFVRQPSEGLRYLSRIIAVLTLTSLIVFIQLSGTNQPAAYFLMPTRLWELGIGSIAFLVINNTGSVLLPLLARVRPLPVIIAIVTVLFIPLQFSVHATIAVVILTTLSIVSLRPHYAGYKLFSHPTVVYIGLISYSLYLWHWSILSISRWTIGLHWWSVPLQAGLILLTAVGSYHYVEKPLRGTEWSSIQWKTLAYGLVALVGTAGVLVSLAKPMKGHLYTGSYPKMIATGVQSLTDIYSISNGSSEGAAWSGEKCILSNNSQVGKIISIEECTLGDFSSAKHRVLVLGNSYSAAFVQAFDQFVLSDKNSVTITSSWGASPVPEIPNNTPWDQANNYYWGKVIPSLISHLREGDWVFLINDMAGFSPELSSISSEQSLRQLELGLLNLSNQLSKIGIHLAVLHGIPFAREANCEPFQAAKQWFAPFGGPCLFLSKEQTLTRRAKLDTMLSRLHSQGRIAIVDLIDVFCPDKTCTYNANNGQILYRDVFSHPSVEAVRLSAPLIRDVFLKHNSLPH